MFISTLAMMAFILFLQSAKPFKNLIKKGNGIFKTANKQNCEFLPVQTGTCSRFCLLAVLLVRDFLNGITHLNG
jgi:hypothetical protein